MKNNILFQVLVVILLSLLLTGCSTAGSREMGNEASSRQEQGLINESVTFGDIPELWYNSVIAGMPWALFAIIVCWIIGGGIFEIFRKLKEVKKWAWSFLILKIPGIIFLNVFLYYFLYNVLNISSAQDEKIITNVAAVFWYNSAIIGKRWVPGVICVSCDIGWLIIELFRKNKEVQKWSWTNLIFRIPGISFVFIYLYCFLYGVAFR